MRRPPNPSRMLGALALAAGLLLPAASSRADDTVLFTANVAPNVLLILDNSQSMRHIVWHEDFDPNVVPSCNFFTDGQTYFYSSDSSETHCGNSRTIFNDNALSGNTRYTGRYLNWLFSDAADAAYQEIQQDNNAFPSSCVGGNSFAKYKRSRLTTAKQAIKDIVCEVNQVKDVKFGFMMYRDPGTAGDPNGGYVRVPVDYYSSNQASDLNSKVGNVTPIAAGSPLSESLFQAYTYYMSRSSSDLPVGVDNSTVFPAYEYDVSKSGVGGTNDPSKAPPSPVEFTCQKHFVMIITDGGIAKDDFDEHTPKATALGFPSFGNLIGDYNNDGETELPAGCDECSRFVDDIAGFMQTNDFRPDLAGDQVVDTYTVGFGTDASVDSLLSKTAAQGNGIFFKTNDAQELAQAIIDAFSDIIRKSQSFTAATVPATRTSAGENLYISRFVPSGDTPYWEGHVENYLITGAGEIHDANGDCAVDDPTPGECFSGPIKSGAVPFWDAGQEVPLPSSRSLSTTLPDSSGDPQKVAFDTSLDAADLGVTYPPAETYPGSSANSAEGLADEIIQNVRGCKLGTGVQTSEVDSPAPCTPRSWRLGDIFHSNPVVVGPPALFLSEPSYQQFSSDHSTRDKVLYAGANDGFLRGFLTGEWDSVAGSYDHGTGEELFGFMPWPGRKNIRHLPIDTNGRDYYFVDGTATVSDAWFYDTPTQQTKSSDGSEWRTVLLGGMREGGPTYYALDITDPDDSDYPGYLWEFPAEDAPSSLQDYFGETWGEAVVTRVRVKVGLDDCGGSGCERWVAIVSGGYHPNGDPNDTASYDSTATEGRAIFMVDLKTGEVLARKRFDPLAPGPQADMVYAIASTPGVYDLDGDSFADVIYVGDLGGNLWKWVISPVGEDRVNDGSSLETQPNWPFRKVFEAPIAPAKSGSPEHFRSFFFPPAATFHEGKLWLAFGSGERENLNYEGLSTRDDENRFYAFKDPDPEEKLLTPAPMVTESDLDDVSADESCSLLSAGARGYLFEGEEGEKFVTNVDVFQHFVFVGSFVPTPSSDPCTTGGEARLYSFRINCGEGFFEDDQGDPIRSITIGAGLPTDTRITLGTGGDPTHRAIINKQDGGILNKQAPKGLGAGIGQFYWRELND